MLLCFHVFMMAVVLKRTDFREFDQMISVYTKDKGKLILLARGVKKITSKNAAHLEPFCFVMIEVAPGREIDHLTKVVSIDLFVNSRRDFDKSLAASYAVSLLDKLTEVGEPDRKIWEATLSWLRHLEKLDNLDNLVALVDSYTVTLLYCLGFKPILDRCVVCGKTFQDMVKQQLECQVSSVPPVRQAGKCQMSGLYFAGGGLICPVCFITKQKIGEEIAACGLKEISVMQMLLTGNWRKVAAFELPEKEKTAVHRLVLEYARYHSERRVGDWVLSIAPNKLEK